MLRPLPPGSEVQRATNLADAVEAAGPSPETHLRPCPTEDGRSATESSIGQLTRAGPVEVPMGTREVKLGFARRQQIVSPVALPAHLVERY
jgi:hypothetical protein